MSSHRYSRLSLFYLSGYLCGAGFGLAAFPAQTLSLLLSNGEYRTVMPRADGFLMLALGSLYVQLIRLGIHTLYPTLVWVRLGAG